MLEINASKCTLFNSMFLLGTQLLPCSTGSVSFLAASKVICKPCTSLRRELVGRRQRARAINSAVSCYSAMWVVVHNKMICITYTYTVNAQRVWELNFVHTMGGFVTFHLLAPTCRCQFRITCERGFICHPEDLSNIDKMFNWLPVEHEKDFTKVLPPPHLTPLLLLWR